MQYELDPLFRACLTRDFSMTQWFLREHPNAVNARDDSDITPIMFAAQYGCTEIVSLLMELGADITEIGPDRYTAIHYAARRGDPAVLKLFIGSGVSSDIVDGWGNSPIVYAVSNHRLATVKYLCEETNCNIDICSVGGTPIGGILAWAAYWAEQCLKTDYHDEGIAVFDYLEKFLSQKSH